MTPGLLEAKVQHYCSKITADINFDPRDGLGFIGRIQPHTLFNFSVDLSFDPVSCGEEAGVTFFLTQYQHIDLGLVGPGHCNWTKGDSTRLRFRVTTFGKPQEAAQETKIIALPDRWRRGSLQLKIWASDDKTYRFFAGPISKRHQAIEIGSIGSTLLSGGPVHSLVSLNTVPRSGCLQSSVDTTRDARWCLRYN